MTTINITHSSNEISYSTETEFLRYINYLHVFLTTYRSALVLLTICGAWDGDEFSVVTVVGAPAVVLTVCDDCFRTIAANVVQPYLYMWTGSTMAVANKLSDVSMSQAAP